MKVAACVILYNPGISVEWNIQSYLYQADKVFIADNTEARNPKIQFANLSPSTTIILADGGNQGIARRLNQACELAIQDGFKYLLTMDQDSYFDEAAITNYLKCLESFAEKSNVAVFGVNHEAQEAGKACAHHKADFLITSGSIVNLEAYKQIGGFDENLFIDFVDLEYCLRSRLKGFDIIQFPNIFLHHNLGETFEKRSLKSLQKTSRSFHSPLRLYYMARNFLYVNKKYRKAFQRELSIFRTDLLNRIKNKLLYQPGRIKTIQYLLKAVRHYRQDKMGKLPD